MERTQQSASLLDTHNRLVADVLGRYRALVMLATAQARPRGADAEPDRPEATAVTGLSMQIELDGLQNSVKELLSLSRRLKELWLFGPLGGDEAHARARAVETDRAAAAVAGLVGLMDQRAMERLASEHGGRWEPLETLDVSGIVPLQ